MRHSANALCEALNAAGVRVHAPDRTRLLVTPRQAVSEELAARIRRYKAELIGALHRTAKRFPDGQLGPCLGCDSEFVHTSERLCPWCRSAKVEVSDTRAVTELHTAESQSAPRTTVLTVPESVKTPLSHASRDSRTVRTLNHPLQTCARA